MLSPVGIAKGPGDRPHEFTLISPDRSDSLKTGEFILYDLNSRSGETQSVFSRVVSRRPVRLLPDSFLAVPNVPPHRGRWRTSIYRRGRGPV